MKVKRGRLGEGGESARERGEGGRGEAEKAKGPRQRADMTISVSVCEDMTPSRWRHLEDRSQTCSDCELARCPEAYVQSCYVKYLDSI